MTEATRHVEMGRFNGIVRPLDDPEHDIYLRVWCGQLNSAVIMPRSDNPLPRHGKPKDEILKQMQLIGGKRLNDFYVWLIRMQKA